MNLRDIAAIATRRQHHKHPKGKRKRHHVDFCDCDLPTCDGCNVCDCDLGLMRLLRLSSLLLAVAALAPRSSRAADKTGLSAISAYQRWLSPRLNTHCRFTPTCSGYGAAAVDRFGMRSGLRLTASRLRRCGPSVTPGTPDPVPPLVSR